MNSQTIRDNELVKRLIINDEVAFSELYAHYRSDLYAFCFTFIKSTDEVEDLIQEIFIYIWESRKSLKPELNFSSYIHTIARNRSFSYLRKVNVKDRIEKELYEKVIQNKEIIESDLIYKEYIIILKQTIYNLPPQRQRIFNMSRMDNLTHKEIAKELNISVYTVQEHISESLRVIKNQFSKIELDIEPKKRFNNKK